MGLVSRSYTYSAGAVIVAAQHNDNENTLYNLVNGNLSTANLASNAGIVDTQLAAITTVGKVNTTALTISSQATADLIVASSSSAWKRLPIGTALQVLRVNSGATDLEYGTPSAEYDPGDYTDVLVSDTTDRTTTSSTYGDVTSETSTFTVGKAGLTFVSYTARADSGTGIGYVALLVDGTVVMEAPFLNGVSGTPISLTWSGVLSAASHTVKIQLKNSDNSSTMTLKNTVMTARLRVSHPS